jgi:hypothetical protein
VRRFVVPILLLISFIGCYRSKESGAPATNPSAQPLAVSQPVASTTQIAATSQPKAPPIAMKIEDRLVQFPPAKLRVGTADGKVVALLYTDDPKDAIKNEYSGNSFYFQMQLDADEVKNFADSDWRFKAESNEQADTPYGIFLDGHRKQLQPVDVAITFEPAGGDQTLVSISGKFLMINVEDASQPTSLVPLLAEFTAKTVLKS